jgi:endonuclease YncB( thermonuclease family)
MIEPNYVMNCTCTRVVDGDTAVFDVSPGFNILMQGLTFRFNGINAPELKSKVLSTAARAREAKAFVTNAILGKDVGVLLFCVFLWVAEMGGK